MKLTKQLHNIFSIKRKRRKILANLPITQKFDILLNLQKITSPILRARGIERNPWMDIKTEIHDSFGSEHPSPIIIESFYTSKLDRFGYIDLRFEINYNNSDVDHLFFEQ